MERKNVKLCDTTGVATIDAELRVVVELLEQHFPLRVRGYYLVGSYAVGEALPASDIDLFVLFKGTIDADEQAQFDVARAACKQVITRSLDMILESEIKLARVGGVWFQTASRLVYGEDVRTVIPRKPVAAHQRSLMHAVYPLLVRARGNSPVLPLPLDYPESRAEFYGYDRRQIYTANGPRSVGTKDLMNIVLAIASALTLQRSAQYLGSGAKSDIPRQYRAVISDEWSDLVEGSYTLCRNSWGYELPVQRSDRKRLRVLCQRTLAFENHFLHQYRGWLRAEVQSGDDVRTRNAQERLARIAYAD